MSMTLARIISVLTIATILFLAILPGTVNAAPPAPPMPPGLPPASSGGSSGGSGGSSGGSSAPAKFQTYTVELKSTDGTPIGNITALDYYLAKLWAEKIVTIDGLNYTVRMTADMESVPTTPQLDILATSPAPGEMIDATNYTSVAALNITRYSKAGTWVMKPSSVHLYITPQTEALNGIDTEATFYMIRNDTQRSIIYPALTNTSSNQTTIDTLLWYDPQSPSNTGTYTLIGKNAPVIVDANDTQPTTNATTERVGGETSMFALAGTLIFGVVIGLAAMFLFVNRARKQ